MIKALYTSITGMNATQNALSVTSNNIANAQTTGYKKQKAIFDDLLYNNSTGSRGNEMYAGTNPKSIGNGVKLSGTYTDYSGGSITMNGGKTNVAIEGSGFFAVGDMNGGNVQYTRKGTFGVSENYYLTNSEGQYVMAYPGDPATGEVDFTRAPGPVKVPMGTAVGGIQSTKGILKGNIDTAEKGATQELTVFDSAGNALTVQFAFTKQADHNYSYTVKVRNDSKGEKEFKEIDKGNLGFNGVGQITSGQTKTFQFNGNPSFTLDMSQLTNHPTKTTLAPSDIDGQRAAIVKDCQITEGGYVTATYDDGSSRIIGQLAIAMYPNEGGLMKVGNGNYVETPAAGNRVIGVSGQNGAGTIRAGATEGSNVDLSVEFVDLMLYQRGFQGNAKVIKVSDEVLNEVVNLIR